jgi:hypothetical protein
VNTHGIHVQRAILAHDYVCIELAEPSPPLQVCPATC